MNLLSDVTSFNYTPWLVLGAFVAGVSGGAVVNGWRLDAQIQAVKASNSNEVAKANQKALDQFISTANIIHDSAAKNRVDVSNLDRKIETLRKEYKNEKIIPLPVDCAPDPVRVRKLDTTIDAVNQAITGSQSGRTLSNDTKTAK